MNAHNVLCAQLTRDLFVIAKFLLLLLFLLLLFLLLLFLFLLFLITFLLSVRDAREL